MTIASERPASRPRAFDGDQLRRLRVGKRWTWEDVAQRLGVSRQQVKKWEEGANEPGYGQVVALAKLFGLSIEFFDKTKQP